MLQGKLKQFYFCVIIIFFILGTNFNCLCNAQNYPANTLDVISYAKSLSLSVVGTSFRGSWVVSPDYINKIKETSKNLQRTFNSLANVKIASSQRDVKKILKLPQEKRNNGQIWVYGTKNEDGSYEDLTEVFFNETQEHVTGVITFNKSNILENIGVNIGDSIEKLIDTFGEPINEKDFIEDPNNNHYLGLYYLYPANGIGFLIGQDKKSDELLIKGVLVFGKS